MNISADLVEAAKKAVTAVYKALVSTTAPTSVSFSNILFARSKFWMFFKIHFCGRTIDSIFSGYFKAWSTDELFYGEVLKLKSLLCM